MEPLLQNLLAAPEWPDVQLPVAPTMPGAGGGGTEDDTSAIPAFGDVLQRFLDQVNSAQFRADDAVESLALGEPIDVHQVMLSLNEAGAALQMTLQVRGKLLDAYQELMRTQI